MIYKVISESIRTNLISEITDLPLGFQVSIGEVKRSNQANALYWKWVGIIAKEIGYHPDELHESFKREFIGVDQGIDIFGNIYLRPKSSASLKKKEFSEYMNKVAAFAESQNIKLPQPDYYGLSGY